MVSTARIILKSKFTFPNAKAKYKKRTLKFFGYVEDINRAEALVNKNNLSENEDEELLRINHILRNGTATKHSNSWPIKSWTWA